MDSVNLLTDYMHMDDSPLQVVRDLVEKAYRNLWKEMKSQGCGLALDEHDLETAVWWTIREAAREMEEDER